MPLLPIPGPFSSSARILRRCGIWVGLILAAAPMRAEFTTGVVAKSDGADFHQHTTPQVARLGDGRLMATMGLRARNRDVRARIGACFSEDGGRTWSAPRVLHQETQSDRFIADANILVDGNEVFVYWTRVYYPNEIKRSWTWGIHSKDNGGTWTEPRELQLPRQYHVGKQHNGIRLADGTYAMGISWDRWPERGYNARTEGETNIATGILLSRDGFNWNLFGDLHVYIEKTTPKATHGLAEPAIVQLADGEIYMLLRAGGSCHYEARSRDGGVTWSAPQPSPLVGHNSPSALWRVEGQPNEILVAWNHSPLHRLPLSVALSADGGRTWSPPRVIAASKALGVSYPGLTQAADGSFVAVWQAHPEGGGREVRYARFTREWVLGEEGR